ncbi:MAG TPA: VOC family protein [Chloroflexota bacterium]|jgi:PhnB protein|nr:VOC family protein [Chloroflexota bacterium]
MSTVYTCPYINFQGRAREALEFYQQVLGGGKLDLLAMDDMSAPPRPAGPGDRIAHAHLDAEGAAIMGSDGHPDYPPTNGDNMAIALSGKDRDRLARAFSGLSDGGTVKMPLAKQSWGGDLGIVLDRFGINWMVSIEPE